MDDSCRYDLPLMTADSLQHSHGKCLGFRDVQAGRAHPSALGSLGLYSEALWNSKYRLLVTVNPTSSTHDYII